MAGLRREEVAMLAGVSADYYTRLERGSLVGASDSVLEALARRSSARRRRTRPPVRPGPHGQRRRRSRRQKARRRVAATDQAGDPAGARRDHRGRGDVRNERGDIVASNRLGYALYSEIHAETVQPPNVARYTFLNPGPKSSSSIGTRRPPMSSPCCAPPSAATPTTSRFRIWSANCQPAATNSACAGLHTTSADTRAAPNACGIPSSARSS